MMEQTILTNLIHNEDYVRKVIPYLKPEYFHDIVDRSVYGLIVNYFDKYNTPPSIEALSVDLSNTDDLSEDQFKSADELIDNLVPSDTAIEWLTDETEKFCQEKAVYNAIMESISVIDGKSSKGRGALPSILSDALSISFDPHIGHDFLDDAEERWEYYHKTEIKVPFDIDLLNEVSKGGLSKKTLNIILAGTGVGKSMFMCHCAAGNLRDNKNVLYITLEMAEERIAERIDANLMGVTIDEVRGYEKEVYDKKIARLRENHKGKIVVKEYPTTGAGANHFRFLLQELKIKKNFIPDIIYVDYLNICMSARIKYGAGVNSYTYVKAIAEELRGLAVEFDLPVVSATQTTRSGFTSSDLGLEDTSESFGLPATADFMFAIISTEEIEELNQILIKQLKNRYSDPSLHRRFVVGVDRSKMTLYNVEQSAQDDIIDTPVFDQGEVSTRMKDVFKEFIYNE
jgi:replicative DNA helicase